MALQGWKDHKVASAEEQSAAAFSTEEPAYDERGSAPYSSDGARGEVMDITDLTAAAPPEASTSDADIQSAQLLTSSEDSALPADEGAPDEMWQAGGDAAAHDVPATSSHKAI